MHLLTADLDVRYTPAYLPTTEADALFAELAASPDLKQGTISMFGKAIDEPRLTAWYSPVDYHYSGKINPANPMPPALDALRQQLEATTGSTYNSVLVNLYRHGTDSISWHADDEAELGPEPVIASVNLGAVRKFKLRPKSGGRALHTIELEHGSLVVMRGLTQQAWQHSVPKTKAAIGPRVNLTFRLMSAA